MKEAVRTLTVKEAKQKFKDSAFADKVEEGVTIHMPGANLKYIVK